MSGNGKGDTPRPYSVTIDTYKNNFDRIFGKKDETCEYSGLPSTQSYADNNPYVALHREYERIMQSGMFFELFPDLTGTWELDKERFRALHR
jgi:hypothetical protein